MGDLNGLLSTVGAGSVDAAGGGAGPWWAVLVPLLPLLSAVLCGVCAAAKVKSKLPAWITVGCLAGSFVTAVMMFMSIQGHGALTTTAFEWINFNWTAPGGEAQSFIANFGLRLDNLTGLWMLFVTGLATLIALYASEYMSHDVGKGYSRFFFAFSLFVFAMACLVMADNLILLYLGWEGVGLCSYLLIGYFYTKPSAVAAAKKAFIVNRIGDLFLALGIMLCYVHFGSVEYAVIFEKTAPYLAMLQEGRIGDIPALVQLIPALLMIGAFGKSAQLPLYVWLPDAMEGPTPVSALIHAATMVTAGVFLIARTYPLFLVSEYALPVVAWIGALTALLAATIGMAQFDIKRIMAYSTVSQLGYMFCGLAVLSATGGVFHVVTHAFFKALLFLCCGAVMHGFAGQLDLRKLSGVMSMKGWGIVGVGMLVGCLNLAGFPFTAGYFSKDMILAESFVTPGMAPIGWILLLTAGLTAYYTFRVFFRVFVGPQHAEPGEEFHAEDPAHGADVAEEEHFAEEARHAHGHSARGHDGHPHGDHAHGNHGHFHPHAPGWAINTVLAILAVGSLLAAGLYFMGDHGGFVGSKLHGTTAEIVTTAEGHTAAAYLGNEPHAGEHSFLGLGDPHKVMYYVSAVVGFIGIAIAAVLHGPKGLGGLMLGSRTEAARSKADNLLPAMGPIAKWAQHKWYVDEFYDLVIYRPLRGISHVFRLIDQFVVDGFVALAGWLPRAIGRSVRPLQNGELHGYAVGMAGGIAVLLLIVLLAVS